MRTFDEDYNKAVATLSEMTPNQLAMAGMTCKMMQSRALEAALDVSPEDAKKLRAMAVEMVHMSGEVTKQMLRVMTADGHPVPKGLTLEAALSQIDTEVEDESKKLETA